MKKLELWQLLLVLLIASGLTFGIAYFLDETLDYSGLFLNLSTEFIMVIVTVWYVDRVLKRHEGEKWKDIDELLKYKLYHLANSAIETLCSPIGLHDINLPEYQLFRKKQEAQDKANGAGIETDYYGDFAEKFLAGHFITDTEIYHATKEWSRERIKKVVISTEICTNIGHQMKKYMDDTNQIIDFYGNRVTAEQLKALMNFQLSIQYEVNSFDYSMNKNEWFLWYQSSLSLLRPCLDLLEALSLRWKMIAKG